MPSSDITTIPNTSKVSWDETHHCHHWNTRGEAHLKLKDISCYFLAVSRVALSCMARENRNPSWGLWQEFSKNKAMNSHWVEAAQCLLHFWAHFLMLEALHKAVTSVFCMTGSGESRGAWWNQWMNFSLYSSQLMVPSEGRYSTRICEGIIMRKDDWVEDVPKQWKIVPAKESKLGSGGGDRWLPQLLLRKEMSWVPPKDFLQRGLCICAGVNP